MKNAKQLIGALLFSGLLFCFTSCEHDKDDKKTGSVAFASNYDILDCVVRPTVYIDDVKVGVLKNPSVAIGAYDGGTHLTKDLPVGEYTYRMEFNDENGAVCIEPVTGTFSVLENECTKVFVDIHTTPAYCGPKVLIDQNLYENMQSAPFTIAVMDIQNDCLTIEIAASGCDGDTWTTKLVASEEIAGTNPLQRNIKVDLDNKEECLAVIKKEYSFYIKDLQVEGTNQVQLNINGQSILYEYPAYCGSKVLIDQNLYENMQSAPFTIAVKGIQNDCLTIEITSSGCDERTWITKLIASEEIAGSNPPQRNLKIFLDNTGICLAAMIIKKEYSFCIKELQVEGTNQVQLKINDQSILYEYD